jgi:hypothetical protein
LRDGLGPVARRCKEKPRRGKDAEEFSDKVTGWKDLLDAERTRVTITTTPDEKWSENFATPKEQMLKSVDERIHRLRKKLGLVPQGE